MDEAGIAAEADQKEENVFPVDVGVLLGFFVALLFYFQYTTMVKFNVLKPNNFTSEEVTKLYFSLLSENDVLNLYKLYEYDFLMFNYTFMHGTIKFGQLN